MRKPLYLAFLTILCLSALGQQDTLYYRFNFETPVINANNDTLKNPWGGGLNQPQLSSIDLNADGKKDIVVFDRSGSSILTYIAYTDPQGKIQYTYDPQYEKRFPRSEDILLLNDYNKDGREDCWYRDPFDGYVKLAENKGDYFEIPSSFLNAYNFGNPPFDSSNFVLWIGNHPAIDDVDLDGDIDFLSTDYCGTELVFYQNNAIENKKSLNERSFEIPDRCFGNLGEDVNGLALGAKCFFPNKSYRYKKKHCASKTLSFYDVDNDGDKDLFIGNSEDLNNSLLLIINGKKDFGRSIDTFIRIDSFYVDADARKAMALAPAVYFIDIDQDGLKDMILSGNESRKADYPVKETDQVTFLRNLGTTALPDFQFSKKDFLVGDMIDLGAMSQPVLHDVDGDKDLDLIIVSNGDHYKTGDKHDRLTLFENVGTSKTPIFKHKVADLWNISNDSLKGIYPTFGDLNNDGNPEMLMGTENGNFALYENIGTLSSPNYKIIGREAFNLNVSTYPAPQLVDLNRDGKTDLLVGTREGNIVWYENTGTPLNAQFTWKSDSFGFVIINELFPTDPPRYNFNGYSCPQVTDLDNDGKYDLLVGGLEGYVKIYRNIERNLNGTFKLSDSITFGGGSFYNHDLGARIKPFAADLNGDTIADILTGNSRGGLNFLRGHLTKYEKPGSTWNSTKTNFKMYPNPAKETVRLEWSNHVNGDISLLSLDGKILQKHIVNGNMLHIALSELPPGIYFVQMKSNEWGSTSKKLTIVR